MLVLSRRHDQKIRFPNLGIEVQILKITGGQVRVGVSAPPDILVLRGELPQPESKPAAAGETPTRDRQTTPEHGANEGSSLQKNFSKFRHDVRNRLNVACVMLEVLQRKIETQQWDEVEPMLERTLKAFHAIDEELGGHQPSGSSQSTVLNQPSVLSHPSDSNHPTDSSHPTGRLRILIVEDNENEGQLLADYLTSFECEATLVGDGRQALHYLRQNGKPDLVLLDMNTPTLDGPSTIRIIREQSEFDGLRIYGVSGMQPDEAGVSIGPDGADGWYTKPIRARRLVEDIMNTLVPSS